MTLKQNYCLDLMIEGPDVKRVFNGEGLYRAIPIMPIDIIIFGAFIKHSFAL